MCTIMIFRKNRLFRTFCILMLGTISCIILFNVSNNNNNPPPVNVDNNNSPLNKQIDAAFGELTNRLKFSEMDAHERRLEINKKMDEIRFLRSMLVQQRQAQNQFDTPQTSNTNSSISLKVPENSPEFMNFPTIFSLMPYMKLTQTSSIKPIFRIAAKANGIYRFVFGIPTVKRPVESYLIGTLQNLIQNINSTEHNQACFVVLIAEIDINFVQKVANEIVKHFPGEIKSGLIEIISPPASFYPNMTSLRQTLGDTIERVQWRSKQNLDYAYLMMYCQSKGVYYVQLEDDLITKPSFLTQMQTFITESTVKNRNWIVLEFCSLGFIGKTFKSADLSKLVLFFMMFFNDKPVDWLLDHFVNTKICHFDLDKSGCKRVKEQIWFHRKPSLFQHVGTQSSLKGKIQKLSDKDFSLN